MALLSELLAENFVNLQEEVEIHSDGHRKLIRPAKMCLARVSVLRGQGPLSGVPFIDDHIHTSQPIVDYLTEFSGIMRKSSAFAAFRAHGCRGKGADQYADGARWAIWSVRLQLVT